MQRCTRSVSYTHLDVYKRQALADLVVNGKEADIPKGILKTEFTSEFTKDEFEAVVKKTDVYKRQDLHRSSSR